MSVAVVLLSAANGWAADVYASTASDGSVRYATQALDSSYRLALREATAGTSATPLLTSNHRAETSKLKGLADTIARRHGLDSSLVQAVVAVESGYRADARSAKGAQGAMQLMPATASRYGLVGQEALRDPERNIDAGVRHLKALLVRHKGNVALALAAYNAGSGAVERHGNRIPPYAETMLYVPSVLARTRAAPAFP
jgi:soluble lytic murein transglycosylase-like protein